jgi:hypothetical protein
MQRDQAYQRQADAADLANLVATSELLRGNIQTAKDNIERSLTLKYADAEQALNNEMFFYEKNWNRLTAAQQSAASARMELVSAQKDLIAQQKNEEAQRFQFMAAAAQAGAGAKTIEDIKNGTLEDEAAIANSFVGSEARIDKNLSRELTGLQMAQTRQQIAKNKEALEEDNDFKFSSGERTSLLGVGLSSEEVKALQAKVREVGVQAVIDSGVLNDDQKNIVNQIFGLAGPSMTPQDEAAAQELFGEMSGVTIPTEDEARNLINNKADYDKFGFWSGPDTGKYIQEQQVKRDEKVKPWVATYKALRAQGLSHQEAMEKITGSALK